MGRLIVAALAAAALLASGVACAATAARIDGHYYAWSGSVQHDLPTAVLFAQNVKAPACHRPDGSLPPAIGRRSYVGSFSQIIYFSDVHVENSPSDYVLVLETANHDLRCDLEVSSPFVVFADGFE